MLKIIFSCAYQSFVYLWNYIILQIISSFMHIIGCLYRMNICIPFKFIMLKPNAQYDGSWRYSFWEVIRFMREESSWTVWLYLQKRWQRASTQLPPCKVSIKKKKLLSINMEACPHKYQICQHLYLAPLGFQNWEINFCCLQAIRFVFCYSSPNGLRQLPMPFPFF